MTRRVAVLLLAAATGCASVPPAHVGGIPHSDPCLLTPTDAIEAGRLVFGLSEGVDPNNAPLPTNDAERIVFRNLYETLVTLDCDGRCGPGLATSWTPSDEERVWTFALRDGATFWNGAKVTAYDVVAAWEDAATAARTSWPSPSPWTDGNEIEARADGAMRVVVRLRFADGAFPVRLAHPAFAVTVPPGAGDWPLGSGPFRPLSAGNPVSGDLVCVPSGAQDTPGAGLSHLVFRYSPRDDPRDLLATGVDLFLVRERDVAEYVWGSFDFALTALPPDRLQLLVSRFVKGVTLADPFRSAPSPADEAPYDDSRVELARYAVLSDAGPAVGIGFPDLPPDSCVWVPGPLNLRPGPVAPDGWRLAYPEHDADARSLAERIASLSGSGLPPWSGHFVAPIGTEATSAGEGIVAVGLPLDEFADALRAGMDAGYVVTLVRQDAAACGLLPKLTSGAPWLTELAADWQSVPWPAAAAGARLLGIRWVVPLVVSRPHLAYRRGLSGIRIDGGGTPLLAGAGWDARGGPSS